jgi:carbamoyltransferase
MGGLYKSPFFSIIYKETNEFRIVLDQKLNSKILSINGCHDASVTFVDKNGELRIFEYERFCKKRFGIFKKEADHTPIGTNDDLRNGFIDYIKTQLLEEPELILHSEMDYDDIEFLKTKFPNAGYAIMGHHMSHCAGAYFQSGFENALVFSLDGGGRDYISANFLDFRSYSFYIFIDGRDQFLFSSNDENSVKLNPGIYGVFGHFCSEISKNNSDVDNSDKFSLSYAGKIMGLSAYGKVREEWVEPIKKFYHHTPTEHWNYADAYLRELSDEMGVELAKDCFSGQDSYDLAATNQYVFEELCFNLIKPIIDEYNLNVVFSGGCALNVLFNQKLVEYLDEKGLELYVPPYPSDCGLSFGHYTFYTKHRVDPSPYCGIGILDRDKVTDYYTDYFSRGKVKYSTVESIVDLITEGKIGGIIQGYSEVGPRALGNRSIICDPSFPDMKDIINKKVKFREWFRPFAPVCPEELRDEYFDKAYPSEYMSFAPSVKEEYREILSSITHIDGTARLQTVNEMQHSLFYAILKELEQRGKPSVILNTSFNIKGKPILTSVEDAFYVLENTELDFIVIENLLFYK